MGCMYYGIYNNAQIVKFRDLSNEIIVDLWAEISTDKSIASGL